MREIKFRAWDKKVKKFFYFDNWNIENIDEEGVRFAGNCEELSNEDINKKNWEFTEFIDIKDKEGKEMYEGDIVNYFGKIFECVHCKGHACFGFNHLGGEENIENYYFKDSEIIGNKFENLELLKEDENGDNN